MSFFEKILRMGEGRILKRLDRTAREVVAKEDEYAALSDEELKVESSNDNLSASLKSLSRFYFLENTPSTNIGQHNNDIAEREVPTISNGHIFLRHLPAGTHIRIYTLSGQQLAEKRIPNSGDMEIDMTIYPKGTYIVSMPQGQLKIMNK